MLKKIMALPLAVVLAACASNAPPPPAGPLHFTNSPPLALDVVTVDVLQDYQPSSVVNAIDPLMAISPASAVRTWVADRIRTKSDTGFLRVTIKDARVVKKPLDVSDGPVTRLFTREQSYELDARLLVEIYGERRDSHFVGYTTIEVTHRTTVPENASDAELAGIERKLVEEMMAEFDQKAEQGILKNLPDLLLKS